jgi:hypothetical protein
MISVAIACALIIYLFGGTVDSANDQGIAWAAKMMCLKLINNKQDQ